MSEFDLRSGRGTLGPEQLLELVIWHRSYGLKVGFAHHADGAASLNGEAGPLVTELLRLATLGAKTELQARDVAGICQQLVVEADAEWKRRFRS